MEGAHFTINGINSKHVIPDSFVSTSIFLHVTHSLPPYLIIWQSKYLKNSTKFKQVSKSKRIFKIHENYLSGKLYFSVAYKNKQ